MAQQYNTFRGGVTRRRALLYSLVFKGKLSFLTVALLLLSFLVQPFNQAYANTEEEPQETVGVAEEVRPQDNESEEIVEEEPEVVHDEVAEVEEETPSEESVPDEGAENVEEETTNAPDTQDTNASSTNETSGGDSTDETSEEEVSTTTDPTIDNEPTQTDEADGQTDIEDLESSAIQSLAQETIRQIEFLVNDQNYYQFSRKACVPVGNGAYHCTQTDGEEFDEESVVYADKGEKGNLEIFLKTSRGRVEQITDNSYDDSSPHYDPKSKRVVWQRLIDERYQVVMYDIEEAKEYQLTFSRTNNMEPKVSVDGIVWQAWDGNDWEVMYFDGTYTDQITDNAVQDVTPVIEDGYILWTVIAKDEQEARVYSIEKGEILSIASHEGGSIANPRFVLVYDTKFENGDIITRGFDPSTGVSAPIAAQPAPEPIDIPTPDPIGEIRALINNKSSHEDEFVPDDGASDTASSSVSGTPDAGSDILNLASTSPDTVDAELVGTSTPPFELTEYDLPVVFVDLDEVVEEESEIQNGDLNLSATSSQS